MATFDRSNIFQTELFEKNVLIPYLMDYRNVTNFARFMGGSDAVIYNKMEKEQQKNIMSYKWTKNFLFFNMISIQIQKLK